MIDEAIDKFGEITYALNTSSDTNMETKIKNIIPDPRHRSRIINVFGEFWPGEENRYEIFLETNHFDYNPLKKERRNMIQHLAKKEQKLEKEKIIGVLAGAHVIRKRQFKLETTDGKEITCQFKKELDKTIDDLLRKPIIVEGIFRTAAGELKDIAEIISINSIDNITINRIITEIGELKLKQDLKINISFDKDESLWVFNYPDLKIIAYGTTYEEAISEFQNDFYELYEHYGLGDPNKMHENAINIRNIFKKLVE